MGHNLVKNKFINFHFHLNRCDLVWDCKDRSDEESCKKIIFPGITIIIIITNHNNQNTQKILNEVFVDFNVAVCSVHLHLKETKVY